jgi:hypothetical protein
MIDPRLILKPEKVVDEIRIHTTFLLKRDPKDRMITRSLEPEEAIEILKSAPEQWYNNYLITFGKRKEARREALFKKLFEIAPPYTLNIIDSVEKVRSTLYKVLESS